MGSDVANMVQNRVKMDQDVTKMGENGAKKSQNELKMGSIIDRKTHRKTKMQFYRNFINFLTILEAKSGPKQHQHQIKNGAFRNNLFYAKDTFYCSKTNDSEDRRIDFRSKKRSKNDVKTKVQCEVDSRPVFHHLRVGFGTILAPKTKPKSIKKR